MSQAFAQPTRAPLTALLVGHRGTGKTTLAMSYAQAHPEVSVIDLDAHLEAHTGQPAAALVAADEDRFRALERQRLQQLLDAPTQQARLIALGAGCGPLPTGVLCIWLWRDGWDETAAAARARLRPQWPWAQELAWMRQTREPRWAKAAHLRLEIARGQSAQTTLALLESALSWADQARDSAASARTWLVPSASAQVPRALADQAWMGLAGVEHRSDLLPELTLPEDSPHLLSVRHEDPAWLIERASRSSARARDLDARFAPALLKAKALDASGPPRRLLLSTHPERLDEASWRALLALAAQLAVEHPAWAPHLAMKVAPQVRSMAQLGQLLSLMERIPSPWPLTLLPQGQDMAWTRPLLMARGNVSSYMPVGLSPWRAGLEPSHEPAPWDYQDWLPHLIEPQPVAFDGLIGQPVRHSLGDWWHRRQATRSAQPWRGYVKIPLPEALTDEELTQALTVLAQLGLRGLSVTAPHKRAAARVSQPRVSQPRDAAQPRQAVNTLTRHGQRWLGEDTDEVGMVATLDALRARGVGPGPVVIFGRGGVSDALTRAVAQAPGWSVARHVSARQGWPPEPIEPKPVAIINASGDLDAAYQDPPQALAWVDLHYRGVRPAPASCQVHLSGDVFFDAQAQAQRLRWACPVDP